MNIESARSKEERGDMQGALREYQRALHQSTDSIEQTELLIRMGTCLLETDLDEAEERISQARLSVGERASNRFDELMGEIEVLEGRLAQARGSHRLAHSKLTSAAARLTDSDGRIPPELTIRLASAERARGEMNAALELLGTLDVFELNSQREVLAEFYDEQGSIEIAQGNFKAAIETLTVALQLDSRQDVHLYKSGRSRLLLAEAYLGRGDRNKAKRLIQEAIECFEQTETGLSEANALMGRWYEEDADYVQAARFYRDGLNLDHESDDDLGEARALRRLARVSRKRGDHGQASDYLERAHALLAGSEDDVELAALMSEEGELAIEQSDYGLAISRFSEAMRRIEDDGEERAIAVAKRKLAQAVWESGDLARAEQLLNDARPVLEERGDLKELDDLLDDLGEVLLERGQYQQAILTIEESLRIDEQLDSKISRARSLLLLGRAHVEIGDQEKSETLLKRALDVYEDAGDDVGLSDALFHLGECQAKKGRLREATKSFRGALALDGRHNDAVGIARAQRGLAGAYRRKGDLSRAQEFIDDATAELTRISDPAERALLAVESGRLRLDLGDWTSAERDLRSAASTFDELGSPTRAAMCRRLLALVVFAEGKYQPAIQMLESAAKVFEEYEARPELDQLYDDLAVIYLQLGRTTDARNCVELSLDLGRAMGWSRGNGRSQLILAQIEMLLKDYDSANRFIADARSSYVDAEDEVGLAAALELHGDLAVLEDKFDDAITSYKGARRIEQGHGNTRGLARIFRKLGETYFARKEYQRAEEAYEQAEDHLRASADSDERSLLSLARGKLAVAQGDHRAGIRYFERSLEGLEKVRSTDRYSEIYRLLAASHQALGQFEDAMGCMRSMGLEQAALWASLIKSLNPEIADAVAPRYLSGEYGDAVLAAFGYLEKEFEARTKDTDERSVSGRIRCWVTPDQRGISPFVDENGLKAYQNFCVSSFGIFRNAAAHKWRDFDGVDAFVAIGVAHIIANYLDSQLSEVDEMEDPLEQVAQLD